MSKQTLNQKLRDLESTIANLKASIAASKSTVLTLPDAIVSELRKNPLTVVEMASQLKTTKGIANLAMRKLANDGILVMCSEPGKRVSRFRFFIAADFPRNYLEHYSKLPQRKLSIAS